MRPLPELLLLSALLAACSQPTHWEKPGADAAALAQDRTDCESAAEQEARRRYPYGYGPPVFDRIRKLSWLEWTQQIDQMRFYAAARMTEACLRDKGYRQVAAR